MIKDVHKHTQMQLCIDKSSTCLQLSKSILRKGRVIVFEMEKQNIKNSSVESIATAACIQ